MIHDYHSIDIGSISQELLDDNILYFREEGRMIRDEIISRASRLECTVLILDFTNVRAIDVSCSDEIVVAIQEDNRFLKGKKIVLQNLSMSHEENIISALEKKKLGIWLMKDGNYELIGKLPKHLVELLKIIKANQSVTARQLADEMSEELSSVSVKLGNLYKKGMLFRKELKSSEGMQYQYYSIV